MSFYLNKRNQVYTYCVEGGRTGEINEISSNLYYYKTTPRIQKKNQFLCYIFSNSCSRGYPWFTIPAKESK